VSQELRASRARTLAHGSSPDRAEDVSLAARIVYELLGARQAGGVAGRS
jgi:hypothetical protein